MEKRVENFLQQNFTNEIIHTGVKLNVKEIFENYFINYNFIKYNIEADIYEEKGYNCVNVKMLNEIFSKFLELKSNRYSVLCEI